MSEFDELNAQLSKPEQYNGCIPLSDGLPVSLTGVNAHDTFNVTAGVGPSNNYGSGAVVCNFREGYNSHDIYMPTPVGFTPPGAFNVRPVPSGPIIACTILPAAPFTRHKWLETSPALEENMSVGRLAAACVELSAATQSTTSASLSGEVAVSAIADFRDLKTWTQNELKTLGVTTTSSFLGKKLSVPSYAFLGPDVVNRCNPIDSTLVLETGRNFHMHEVLPTPNTYGSLIIDIGGVTTAAVTTPYVKQLPKLPSRTQYRFRASAGNYAWGVGQVADLWLVWIRANSDPGVAPATVVTQQHFGQYISGLNDTINVDNVIVGDDEQLIRQGFELGSIIVTAPGGFIVDYELTVLDMFAERRFGGWRILLWQNAGAGQTISVAVTGAVEGVATGTLASFKREGVMDSLEPGTWERFTRAFAKNRFSRVSHGEQSMAVSLAHPAAMVAMAEQRRNAVNMGLLSTLGGLIPIPGLNQLGAGLGQLADNAVSSALGMGGIPRRGNMSMAGIPRQSTLGTYFVD